MSHPLRFSVALGVALVTVLSALSWFPSSTRAERLVGGRGELYGRDYPVASPDDCALTVASDNGITFLNTPLLSDRSDRTAARGEALTCEKWQWSEPVQALGLNSMDERWYYIRDRGWVPAAWVFGDAKNSAPRPSRPDD
jgi:hypothetical protein